MEKQFQKLLFVLFCFIWLILIYKGEKANSESAAIEIPVEITIPARLEVSLEEGKSSLQGDTVTQDLALRLRSNSPWVANIQAVSNLTYQPSYPSNLEGLANRNDAFQIIPFEIEQRLSWGDYGSYELGVIYSFNTIY